MSRQWGIIFSPTAAKSYESVKDEKLLRGINRTIGEIAENPYQFQKLSGPFAQFRKAKTFSYRILFRVMEGKIQVYVLAIGPRADVYR